MDRRRAQAWISPRHRRCHEDGELSARLWCTDGRLTITYDCAFQDSKIPKLPRLFFPTLECILIKDMTVSRSAWRFVWTGTASLSFVHNTDIKSRVDLPTRALIMLYDIIRSLRASAKSEQRKRIELLKLFHRVTLSYCYRSWCSLLGSQLSKISSSHTFSNSYFAKLNRSWTSTNPHHKTKAWP